MSEIELCVGDYVEKVSGYRFTGTVVSAFETLAGKRRVVVDNGDGMLHIFNEGQMRPATRSQSERVSRLEEALKEIAYRRPAGDCKNQIIIDMETIALRALNQGADDGR